jgi:hypothetical protein
MAAILILNALIASLGLTLIVGACRQWKWLVDPPIALVPQIWLSRAFGVRASVVYVCSVGAAIVALAAWGSWRVCCR